MHLTSIVEKYGPACQNVRGGTKWMTRQEFLADAKVDLRRFFKARSSVRNFADQPVDRELIRQAVAMAQKTPSVCNRQTGRVMMFDRAEDIEALLKFHGGARGFSDRVRMLLIVGSDVSRFQSSGERYQAWIEGGMFSCSLVYALHSLGLGTCCLNWSREPKSDIRLLELVPELKDQWIAMFIAVGHLPEGLNVPLSASPAIDEVLTIGPRVNMEGA